MKFSIYEWERKTARELKDALGWWETDSDPELVAVCMILCEKIERLEKQVKGDPGE